ncbi:MAG: hypothetical protein GEV07_22850 [Streptosporangiales bacterium]|nr:hypothetical protein [Streptosporangiales bacterium]
MTRTRTGTGLSVWLDDRSDEELAGLLIARPDLLHPVPADLGRLAQAALSRPSLQLAVDQLDTLALQVLRTLANSDETMTYGELAAELAAPTDGRLRDTVELLRTRALCFGGDAALTTPRELRRMPMLAAEFGPPIVQALADVPAHRLHGLLDDIDAPHAESAQALRDLAKHFASPANVRALIDAVGAPAREALERVAASYGRGRVTNAQRATRVATATSPVEELLARGLLVAAEEDAVVLPFEVAVALPQTYREPPTLQATDNPPSLVEHTGGMHAYAFVQAVEDLLAAWAEQPPSRLRSGGLGVRELRRAATLLDVSTDHAALVVEVAHAARLLDATYPDEEWLPTTDFDTWCGEPVAGRWLTLATAWLRSSRAPGLVGGKDERDKTINALGGGVLHGSIAQVRRATLEVLSTVPPGQAPTHDSVVGRVIWNRPRVGGRHRRQLVEWTLLEGELLGICGHGGLTSFGRGLLSGDGSTTALLTDVLPAMGTEVLVQPDLTAVAPGPLRSDVRTDIGLLADVESTGGATVYRFSPESVRRAFDAGRTAGEVKSWLTTHSRTEVPQPLLYLVDDVARRHGQLRAGSATSYIRSDDTAVLAEIAAHRKAGHLALRHIAPTVLVSQLSRRDLLDGLRELGYAPVAESASGDVVLPTPQARRVQAREAPTWQTSRTESPNTQLVERAVQMLRAGERMAGERPVEHRMAGDRLPRNPPRETLAALHQAIAADILLWIGYANAEGRASLRLIEPVAVLGGLVEAYDHLRETRRTFALHRITGYAPVDETPA